MAQTPQMADLQYLTIEVQGTQHPCTNSKNHNQVPTLHVPLLFFRSKTGQPNVALCGSAWSLVFRVAVVAQFLVGAWWLRNMLHAAIPHLWRGKNGHTSVHTNVFMNWTLHLIQKTSKKVKFHGACRRHHHHHHLVAKLPSKTRPRPLFCANLGSQVFVGWIGTSLVKSGASCFQSQQLHENMYCKSPWNL